MKEADTVIAILYRDSDPTRSSDTYEEKWESIMEGFHRAGFESGVPMIPKQIMEAWLLDSLDWQGRSHADFEHTIGGHSSSQPYKVQLKAELYREGVIDYQDGIERGVLAPGENQF